MLKYQISRIISTLLFACLPISYAIADTKTEFIKQLLPSINHVNDEILMKRQKLLSLHHKEQTSRLSIRDKRWLRKLAAEYKVNDPDFHKASTWQAFQVKVDIIPPSLAIAQAATESGWGQSRFAQQGNNYFGQSCFRPGCGMKTNVKNPPMYYEAATFYSIQDAVRSYMSNLNTHSAYKELRQIRHQYRQQNHKPDSLILVNGLIRYSERGKAYVDYISQMVKRLQSRQLDQHIL